MKEERSINCVYQILQLHTQLTLFVWLQVVCLALYCSGLSAVPLLQSGVASADWVVLWVYNWTYCFCLHSLIMASFLCILNEPDEYQIQDICYICISNQN